MHARNGNGQRTRAFAPFLAVSPVWERAAENPDPGSNRAAGFSFQQESKHEIKESKMRTRIELAAQFLAAIIVRDGAPCTPEAQMKIAYHYADRMIELASEKESDDDERF